MTEANAPPAGGGSVAAPNRITLVEAQRITGLSVSSIHRRVDAWLAGDEAEIASGYALKGGRSGRNRTVDRRDALRLRRQLDGDLVIRSGSESAPPVDLEPAGGDAG